MGTVEEFLFDEYHESNEMCLSLCWLCTRKYCRRFIIALWSFLLAGDFNNSITRVHSISVLLPASIVLSLFILVDWRLL